MVVPGLCEMLTYSEKGQFAAEDSLQGEKNLTYTDAKCFPSNQEYFAHTWANKTNYLEVHESWSYVVWFCNIRHISLKEFNSASPSWHLNKTCIKAFKVEISSP